MTCAPRLSLAPSGWALPVAPRAADRAAESASAGDAGERAPETADAFAETIIGAICAAGVTDAVAQRAFQRCFRALALGSTARAGLRHPGKAAAIDAVWRDREALFRAFCAANDRAAFLETLPGLGPITAARLARDLGLPATEPPRTCAA